MRLHDWDLSPAEAMKLQLRLAALVSRTGTVDSPCFIAGLDISPPAGGVAMAAAVVLKYPELEVAEIKVVSGELKFPYIPGLLSFRESPLTLQACEQLALTPDLVLVDGQGIAHPRRFGLASHIGLLLGTPTIGCAKSLLCGKHEPLVEVPGSYAEIVHGGEVVGAALRTKAGAGPLYVSIGHKIDLLSAIDWVLKCCRGYRVPEPTRLAHLAAAGALRTDRMAPVESHQQRLFEEESKCRKRLTD